MNRYPHLPQYTSSHQLLSEVRERMVIDLRRWSNLIPQKVMVCLVPDPIGLYLPNQLHPQFEASRQYLLEPGVRKGEAVEPLKLSLQSILDDARRIVPLPQGHFYNEQRKLHLHRGLYNQIKTHLTAHPGLSVHGCASIVGATLDYLNNLCPYTHVHTPSQYDLEQLVQPEYADVLNKELIENSINDLYKELSRFVGRDHWNLYSYQVQGTDLILTKGVDYRIYDWHMSEMKRSERYDHDHGLLSDDDTTKAG